MTLDQIVVGVLISGAAFYLVRRAWRKLRRPSGCGGSGNAKKVTLTIGGQDARRRR